MSDKSSHWREPLTKKDIEVLRKEFEPVLKVSRGGILTTYQRQRLLKIKNKPHERKEEKGEDEKKLWFDVRNSSHACFTDLKLICKIASDNQLQDIFEPWTQDDLPKRKDGTRDPYKPYTRTTLSTFLIPLLFEKDDKLWKHHLSTDLVEVGIGYLRHRPEFNSALYQRLFSDVLDAVHVGNTRDSTESGF